jgi:DNA-binding beta-propeller fold protein YncE
MFRSFDRVKHRASRPRFLIPALIASVALSSVPGAASAATAGSTIWARRFDSYAFSDPDFFGVPTEVATSPDGSRVFVAGATDNPTTSFDYTTVAFDAVTGRKTWTARFAGPLIDRPTAIAVSSSGRTVFVTGESSRTNSVWDIVTVAYDASTGRQLWIRRYDDPVHGWDEPAGLVVSHDGSAIFLTGSAQGSGGSAPFAIAYDGTDGATLWTHYGTKAPGVGFGSAIELSPDGALVYVTGYASGTATDEDYRTVAYDAATGARRWSARYNGPANRRDEPNAIAVSPDGSKVFVTGQSDDAPPGGCSYATVAYNAANGRQLWVSRYQGVTTQGYSTAFAYAVAPSPDGQTVFVTGSDAYGEATIAYNATTGAQRWLTAPGGRTAAYSLATSPDGSTVFVSGNDYASGSSNAMTEAYDPSTGALLWSRSYSRSRAYSDLLGAMILDPTGSTLFVVGESHSPTNTNIFAVAYRTTSA